MSRADGDSVERVTDHLTAKYRVPTDEPLATVRLNVGLVVKSPVLVDAELPGHPLMHIRFEAEGGKYVVTGLDLERRPGEPAISAAAVRDLPLAPVVKAIRARLLTAFTIMEQLGARPDGAEPPPPPSAQPPPPAVDRKPALPAGPSANLSRERFARATPGQRPDHGRRLMGTIREAAVVHDAELGRAEMSRTDTAEPGPRPGAADLGKRDMSKTGSGRAETRAADRGGGNRGGTGATAKPGTGRPAEGEAGNQRRIIDDALLRRVAVIAASAPTRPTQAVVERLHTSHRNATRWIAAARKRGLLAPPPPNAAASGD